MESGHTLPQILSLDEGRGTTRKLLLMETLEIIDPTLSVGSNDGEWVLIHPTQRTMGFREVLLGASAYSPGHGIYNAVRTTSTVIRQVQASVLRNILDGVAFEDLAEDWRAHISARGFASDDLAEKYWMEPADAARVAENATETWSFLLRNLLLDFVRRVAEYCIDGMGGADGTAAYARYVDWLTCLGIVPVIRKRDVVDDAAEKDTEEFLADARLDLSMENRLRLAPAITRRGHDMLGYLERCFRAARVMNYDRTVLIMHSASRELRAYDVHTRERGSCVVAWDPMMTERGIVFDSPMQRLHAAVLRTQAVREHAKLCQLVNTAPMSVLVARREDKVSADPAGVSKMVDKALGEGAEEAGQSAAAKLIKFIIDMQNMRKVGDVAEVVDAYLRESGGPAMDKPFSLDPGRVGFGGSGKSVPGFLNQPAQTSHPKDGVADVMRDAVNTSVGKVVNNLFKAVSDLKSANADLNRRNVHIAKELTESRRRIGALTNHAARDGGEGSSRYDASEAWRVLDEKDAQWEMGDTLLSLGKLPESVTRSKVDLSGEMTEDQYVANSFFSRYVPPYLEEETRLSALWEQELLRVFKMHRVMNNQGEEMSISYSNSSISLIVGPFFHRVLKATRLGFLVADDEAYKSEEELCESLFKKSRVDAYLRDLKTTYLADVRNACAVRKTLQELDRLGPRDVHEGFEHVGGGDHDDYGDGEENASAPVVPWARSGAPREKWVRASGGVRRGCSARQRVEWARGENHGQMGERDMRRGVSRGWRPSPYPTREDRRGGRGCRGGR